MAANDTNGPTETGRTDGRKGTGDKHDGLAYYAKAAPADTPVETIIAAYKSDTKARQIDWDSFGGENDG